MLILVLTYELKIENLVFLTGTREAYKIIYLEEIILLCTSFLIYFTKSVRFSDLRLEYKN